MDGILLVMDSDDYANNSQTASIKITQYQHVSSLFGTNTSLCFDSCCCRFHFCEIDSQSKQHFSENKMDNFRPNTVRIIC